MAKPKKKPPKGPQPSMARSKRKRVHGVLRPGIVSILQRTRAARAELDAVIAETPCTLAGVTMADVAPLLPPERYGFAEPRYNSNPRTVTFTLTRTEDRGADADERDPADEDGIYTPSVPMIGPYTAAMLQDPTETHDRVPIVIDDEMYQRLALRAFRDNTEMSDIVEKVVAKLPAGPLAKCACCEGACHHPEPWKVGRRTRFRCGCPLFGRVG